MLLTDTPTVTTILMLVRISKKFMLTNTSNHTCLTSHSSCLTNYLHAQYAANIQEWVVSRIYHLWSWSGHIHLGQFQYFKCYDIAPPVNTVQIVSLQVSQKFVVLEVPKLLILTSFQSSFLSYPSSGLLTMLSASLPSLRPVRHLPYLLLTCASPTSHTSLTCLSNIPVFTHSCASAGILSCFTAPIPNTCFINLPSMPYWNASPLLSCTSHATLTCLTTHPTLPHLLHTASSSDLHLSSKYLSCATLTCLTNPSHMSHLPPSSASNPSLTWFTCSPQVLYIIFSLHLSPICLIHAPS